MDTGRRSAKVSEIMNQREYVVLFILGLVSGSFTCCYAPGGNHESEYYAVAKVVDGDTFWVDDGSDRGLKVRLIGIDAPETRNSGRKAVGYYGAEAKNYLESVLAAKEVRLEYDVDRKDRYGRTLAYAYLRDGTFVNAELVKRGYAMVLTVPPNVRFADEFVNLQAEARKKKRGLWKK